MKGYTYIIIAVLVAIVGYEGYQIEQLKKMVKKEIPKDEPKVTINVAQKTLPSVQNKSWMNNFQNTNSSINKSAITVHKVDTNQSFEELQKTIQEDFHKLFKDIFGNKEVKNQLNQGIQEFQNSINQVMQEFQKQMKSFNVDEVFNELLQGLNPNNFKVFEDKGSYYEFATDLADKNAKVDVNVRNGYISINIKSHIEEKTANQVIKRESQQNYIVKVPKDGIVESIKSEYKNGKLYIIIQKAKGVKSI